MITDTPLGNALRDFAHQYKICFSLKRQYHAPTNSHCDIEPEKRKQLNDELEDLTRQHAVVNSLLKPDPCRPTLTLEWINSTGDAAISLMESSRLLAPYWGSGAPDFPQHTIDQLEAAARRADSAPIIDAAAIQANVEHVSHPPLSTKNGKLTWEHVRHAHQLSPKSKCTRSDRIYKALIAWAKKNKGDGPEQAEERPILKRPSENEWWFPAYIVGKIIAKHPESPTE